MLPILAPIVAELAKNGLNLLANAVTSKGKEFVEDKLGVKLDAKPSEEQLAKLRELEIQHEEFLLDIGLKQAEQNLKEMEVLLSSDDSARKMQVAALQQEDLLPKRFIYYFATGWCIFAAIYILGITFSTIPESSVRFADTVLGFVLGTVVSQIIAFFFGSSHRSSAKDATITALSKEVTLANASKGEHE